MSSDDDHNEKLNAEDGNASFELRDSYYSVDDDHANNGDKSTRISFALENSVSKLPGSSLANATGANEAFMHASTVSNKTWKSNETVHMDGEGKVVEGYENGDDDDYDDDDGKRSPSRSVSSLKSRESELAATPTAKNKNRRKEQSSASWLKKLLETPEEKEKRVRNEKLIARQTASRWGKDILDEEDSTAHVEEEDNNNLQPLPEDEDGESGLGGGFVNTFRQIVENIMVQQGERNDSGLDAIDETTHKSVNTSNTGKSSKNLGTALSTFLDHTFAKFDPKVRADPQFRASVEKIAARRAELQTLRAARRNKTPRHRRQIINSIHQQKQLFIKELRTAAYRYRKDPSAPCVKKVYEAQILRVVHGKVPEDDDDNESDKKNRRESVFDMWKKDDIDKLLDSCNFDYEYAPSGEEEEEFVGKNIIVDHASLVPLEAKVLRAQHNEWMTKNQMELTRAFEQKFVQYLSCELVPKIKEESKGLKDSKEWNDKLEDARQSNAELSEAYRAHVAAQERLIAVYREHDPDKELERGSAHRDSEIPRSGSFDHGNISPLPSPVVSPKKKTKSPDVDNPNLWLDKLSSSVKSLILPDGAKEEDADRPVSESSTTKVENNEESIPDASNVTQS
eukprot:jgi/Psemu1/37437/gm1.37437_g